MSVAAVAIVETSIVTDESRIKQLWATFQAVDRERTRHGLEVGKAMFEYRERTSAQGNHEGKGFVQLCTKLEIPRRTAYYRINAYEESAGIRQVATSAAAAKYPNLIDLAKHLGVPVSTASILGYLIHKAKD